MKILLNSILLTSLILYGVSARAQTITTGPISLNAFCPGSAVSVPYTGTLANFNNGNVFIAQLSDSTGSFVSPAIIGTNSSFKSSGTINATIPATLVRGLHYRIRVLSSSPFITGSSSTTNLVVNGCTSSDIVIGGITGGTFCPGTAVSVPFTTSDIFNSANVFTAQLSDGSGNFGSPKNLGTATTSPINATIPSGASAGTAYRIRIVSSNPAITGAVNTNNITVVLSSSCGSTYWTVSGNGGTNAATNFIGTIDYAPLNIKTILAQPINFLTNNIQAMTIGLDGSVGIGTSLPSAKLDINGQVKIEGGSPGAGKILISDANGLATWNSRLSEFSLNLAIGTGALQNHSTNPDLGGNTALGIQADGTDVDGSYNTAIGFLALNTNIDGNNNTAVGGLALHNNNSDFNTGLGYNALYVNISGSKNTASGAYALYSTYDGNNNVADGAYALYHDSAGSNNSAIGAYALFSNSGNNNVANGAFALYSNTTGSLNTANGISSLGSNTTGKSNTATGEEALFWNTNGNENTADGEATLFNNTSGNNNTASGYAALNLNTTGNNNAAVGTDALLRNTSGNNNTAIGCNALSGNTSGIYNTAIGDGAASSQVSGVSNTIIGHSADVSADGINYSSALGEGAIVNASLKIRLGGPNITVVESAVGSWTTSDGRFKTNISEDVKGLDFIKKLRPVVYNFDTYKFQRFLTKNMPDSIKKNYIEGRENEFKTSTGRRQTGFVAQEVEQAAKDAGYDFNGIHHPDNDNDNYSLSYEKFVVPLVKAVQELSSENDKLNEKNNKLQEDVNQLKAAVYGSSNMHDGAARLSINAESNAPLLGQNIPNPTDNNTLIPFRIPKNCNSASIVISEVGTGRIIRAIPVSCSETQLAIDAGNLASGTYAYSLYIDGKIVDTKQMVLTK